MSIFFNTSGLITRGFGEAAKVITRGFGGDKLIKGLPPKVRILKEYIIGLFSPVSKESAFEFEVFVPVQVIINKDILLKSNVSKQVTKSFNFSVETDKRKLFNILDAI